MAYRSVNFVTNGFAASNYTPAGPLGNQFITPYGDPYRIDGVGDLLGTIVGGITNVLGGIGKIATPLLPGLVQVGVGSLLNKSPQQQQTSTSTQQPSQSQFTQATGQTQAQIDAAAAEKANMVIYVTAGAVALFVAYYFISKRRR
jgi:hypothetical protein